MWWGCQIGPKLTGLIQYTYLHPIDKLYPDWQCKSSLQYNWTFCCPVLGSRHCTCAYTVLQKVTQPAGLASPNSGTSTALYGRGQLGSICVKKWRSLPFSSLVVLSLWFSTSQRALMGRCNQAVNRKWEIKVKLSEY